MSAGSSGNIKVFARTTLAVRKFKKPSISDNAHALTGSLNRSSVPEPSTGKLTLPGTSLRSEQGCTAIPFVYKKEQFQSGFTTMTPA
jgi:hypothetical protein